MRPRADRVRTLAAMLLREQGRERAETLLSVLILFAGGLGLGFLPPDLLRPERGEREPRWGCEQRPAEPPLVAVLGPEPAWLRWPEPLVAPEEAEVLIRVEGPRLELVPLVEQARLGAVRPCLERRVAEERARRLEALGVSEGGEPMIAVDAVGVAGASSRWEPSPARAAVAGALCMVALTGGMSAAARARGSGLRETIAAGPVRPEEWTLALLSLSLVGAALAGALVTAGLGLARLLGGQPLDLPEPAALGLGAFFLACLALRVGHDASDYVSAMGRAVALTFAAMALAGGSLLLDRLAPPWGALVPAGPLIRASFGEPLGATPLLASGLVTAFAALLLLRATTRAVAADDPTLAPSARVVLRRASGDWTPEAVLIGIIGLTGTFFTSPLVMRGDPLAATLLAQLAFLVGPALLAPALFGLDPRRLYGLGWPGARALAATPLVVAGTLGGAQAAALLFLALFPAPEEAIRSFTEQMAPFLHGPGILLVTLGAGVGEELLYRGLLQGLLAERGRVWRAILIQALFFAFAHALGFRLLPTFVIGLLLGLLRWRTGSVLPGILVHVAHNASAVLFPQALGALPLPALLGGAALGLLGIGLARGPAKPPGAS